MVWKVICQLGSALRYCHYGIRADGTAQHEMHTVLHRDIKPSNGTTKSAILASLLTTCYSAGLDTRRSKHHNQACRFWLCNSGESGIASQYLCGHPAIFTTSKSLVLHQMMTVYTTPSGISPGFKRYKSAAMIGHLEKRLLTSQECLSAIEDVAAPSVEINLGQRLA